MATYYHGTFWKSAKCIMQEGFLGSEISECTTPGRHDDNGVVYVAKDIEFAKQYGGGESIVAIELEDDSKAVKFIEDFDTGIQEYYIPVSVVNDSDYWEVDNE